MSTDFLPGDPATHVIGRAEEKPARVHRPPPPKPPATANTILEDIRLRRQQIADDVAEYARLLAADEALTAALGPVPTNHADRYVERIRAQEAEADEAPFGRKADGTPRKRPAPTAATQAKIAARRKRA